MKPRVGQTVLYFPDDERVDIPARTGRVWPAIVTLVHDREYGLEGEEIGPWVVALHAFPPATERRTGESGFPDTMPAVMTFEAVPLAGMYDEGDLEKHPEWIGCWNTPGRGPIL
jgi:hypothetical protein